MKVEDDGVDDGGKRWRFGGVYECLEDKNLEGNGGGGFDQPQGVWGWS